MIDMVQQTRAVSSGARPMAIYVLKIAKSRYTIEKIRKYWSKI